MKYSYNEKFFSTIENTQAYWVGFIMADGYIFDNRLKDNKSNAYGVRIRLKHTDAPHLNKFVLSLEGNLPVRIVKNYGTISTNCSDLAELCLTNKQILVDLVNLGFSTTELKSLNEFIPVSFIKSETLLKSFILGLWDGDGAISRLPKDRFEWSLYSNSTVINFINEFLSKKLNITFNKIDTDHRNNNLFRLRTSKKEYIRKIRDYLYSDNPVYLERKRQILDSV